MPFLPLLPMTFPVVAPMVASSAPPLRWMPLRSLPTLAPLGVTPMKFPSIAAATEPPAMSIPDSSLNPMTLFRRMAPPEPESTLTPSRPLPPLPPVAVTPM